MVKFQTFAEFLQLFPDKPRQKIKNGYNVLCPAHNDRNPSLSVSKNTNKILLHCKAGCLTPQILAKLNISERDLFLTDPQTPTIEAIYQYHDANRQLLFEVVRYTPKAFKQRRPDGKDRYIWNLNSITPVIYRLPDIITAITRGDTIYITEGEKDADTLVNLGLIATTNPMGAGKWKPEYSDSLQGANVVLIPDTDSEGKKHGISVIDSLRGKIKSLEVLQIPSSAKDVTAWLEQGHTKEDLLSLETITVNEYKNINVPAVSANSFKSEQLREQHGTTSPAKWGEFAKKFDEIMREGGSEWQDKRDIAEQIGTSHKDRAYRLLLQRRREDEKIRVHGRNPYLIQWINRDYKMTQLSSAEKQTFLDIKLPLNLHKIAQIPPGSVIGVAGYISSGKTSFLLETAELNALSQPVPVYYWFHEMSEARMVIRCEDFPLLIEAQKQDKFFPVKQGDFEFADVLEPNAINLIDYIDRNDDLFLIGGDIKQLQAKLIRGIVVFALQKKRGSAFGYGGLPSAKLSNLYITLDTKYQSAKAMHGEAKIVKCKDWVDNNPVGLHCEYYTGGKHGKLFLDGEWKRPSE